MKTTHYHVNSVSAAWAKVNEVFPTDYNEDENSSARADYPVFRSSVEYYNYICDLGDRLEVNLESGETVNIWIDESEAFQYGSEIVVCFDHDLGGKKTGYDLAKYIVENNVKLAAYEVHTMNPVGRENIIQLLDHYGYRRINSNGYFS